jgi:hypothetical protein
MLTYAQASIVRAEQLPHALPKWMPDNQEQVVSLLALPVQKYKY